MLILAIGDIVGQPGRQAIHEFLPGLRKQYGLDMVIANGENVAGGFGLTGNTCGAVSGGIIVLSTYMGRDYQEFADTDGKRFDSFRLAKELVNRFESEYGSAACCKIQEKIIGRFYDIWTERDEFLAAGGHDDKCPSVCANAARWIVEILNENKLLEKH